MAKKKSKKKYVYDVERKRGAISVTMKGGKGLSRKEAYDFYRKHPRATHLQRRIGGVTAGIYQPDVPSSITHKGKKYRRAYVGPHTKKTAEKFTRSSKDDKLKMVAKKTKRGYFLYYKAD